MEGKAKWESPEWPLPKKMVHQKQYHIPAKIAEISIVIKALKGVMISTTSPFNSLI